jgi:hypothetical protein
MKIEITKNEIQELLWALYDSENLNRERKTKPVDFLRVGNKPVNTVFDKLMDAKYNLYKGGA